MKKYLTKSAIFAGSASICVFEATEKTQTNTRHYACGTIFEDHSLPL